MAAAAGLKGRARGQGSEAGVRGRGQGQDQEQGSRAGVTGLISSFFCGPQYPVQDKKKKHGLLAFKSPQGACDRFQALLAAFHEHMTVLP